MVGLNVSKKIEDIFDSYNAFVGKTYDRDGSFETKLCVSREGFDYDFSVFHDGTEESFLCALIQALEAFEGVEYAQDCINLYSPANLDDMEWYVSQAYELEEFCENLRSDLFDYMEGTE